MKSHCLKLYQILIALFTTVIAFSLVLSPVHADEKDETTYLPLFVGGFEGPPNECSFNDEAQQLANLMRNDPGQMRSFLRCDPILAQVAQERALDMGAREYVSHVNPDGYGPNYLVESAGYVLPDFYNQELNANNIESIGAGYGTALDVWTDLLTSPGHRAHLLGLSAFYAEQTDFGIGYAYVPDARYGHFWVIITARH